MLNLAIKRGEFADVSINLADNLEENTFAPVAPC